jgi:hypothetical protein
MLQPSSLSVYDLFSLPRTYRAPLYQRSYVWGAINHWEPLWEDIRNTAERLPPKGVTHNEHHEHFLGAIVVQQESVPADEIPSFSIIDGQQRLTTLQIILSVLKNLATSMHEPEMQGVLEQLTENPQRGRLGDLWKIWPTNIDRQAFVEVMKADNSQAIDRRTGIHVAYRFFQKSFSDYCFTEAVGVAAGERLSLLSRAVQRMFKVVVITLSTNDDPHMIFEALNARGQSLLASDLIKNYVFSSVKQEGINPDIIYDRLWAIAHLG